MSSEQGINDENISPEGNKSKPSTPNRRTSSSGSSPFQILRNFASLSNRGSPSSPLGRLFRKVRNVISPLYLIYKSTSLPRNFLMELERFIEQEYVTEYLLLHEEKFFEK